MSVAAERRTVSLWPSNASPVSGGPQRPRQAAVVQHTGETEEPVTQALALAAITSSYRLGRAGIISGDPSPSSGQVGEVSSADLAAATRSPRFRLRHLNDHEPAEGGQAPPASEGHEATTFWSRLLRTRRPAPRGRHAS
jgi:hypothetical protein